MSQHALGKNLRWGITWGLSMAAVYAFYLLAVFLVAESKAFAPDAGSPRISLASVLAAYLAGGILGGLLLGLLRPIAATLPGALGLGFLIAVPVFVGIVMASDGLDGVLSHHGLFIVLVGAATLGPLCAYQVYRHPSAD